MNSLTRPHGVFEINKLETPGVTAGHLKGR